MSEAALVVGCGWMGSVHSSAWAAIGVTPYLLDNDIARAKQLGTQMGAPVLESWDELEHLPGVKWIDLCVPHAAHVDAALRALAYGRHVLIEKPLARTLSEADTIASAVEHSAGQVMVAECFRFHEAVVAARDALRRGVVGSVRLIEGFSIHGSAPMGWRRNAEAMGGGALLDRGIHLLSMLEDLGGPIRRVGACGANLNHEIEGEDTTVVALELASGALGQLVVTWALPSRFRHPLFVVHGSDGVIYEEGAGVYQRTSGPEGAAQCLLDPRPGPLESRETDAICREIAVFADSTRRGQPTPYSVAAGRRDVGLVMACYQAARTGKWIDVADVLQG